MEVVPENLRRTAERQLLYTILDSELVLEDKLRQLAEAIDRDGADIGCTLPDVPALAGVFPLLLAVSVGDAELVEFLVTRGADVNQTMDDPYFQQAVCPTALHQACLDGRLDLVRVLAETDELASSSTFPSSSSSKGRPPTSCHSSKSPSSSASSSSSAFPLYLEPTNARGQTPYHLAVESGNADLVGYLVERGSWIEACDANGNNALHMTTCLAPDGQAFDMVDTLLTLGVSIYHRNRLGFTPVKQAMLLGREATARLMLSRNSVGKGLQEVGFHPLEAAVVNRRRRVISAILDRLQADCSTSPTKVPDTDESLNIVVLNSGLNGILEQLLTCPQMRTHIDVNGSLGYTPLYNACASRNTVAVRLLLEAGADPDRPSLRQHVLPLKKTVLQNDLVASRLLLDFGASACHCLDCSPLLRSREVSSGSQAFVGIRDGELDLLYLALFTDISLCQLLVSGGTCISYKSLEVLCSGSQDHRDLLTDLYRAGHHDILRKILETEPDDQEKDQGPVRDELREALRSPPPLKLICRSRFRAVVKPRVYWAIQKIALPQTIRQYLLLEI